MLSDTSLYYALQLCLQGLQTRPTGLDLSLTSGGGEARTWGRWCWRLPDEQLAVEVVPVDTEGAHDTGSVIRGNQLRTHCPRAGTQLL